MDDITLVISIFYTQNAMDQYKEKDVNLNLSLTLNAGDAGDLIDVKKLSI